MYKEIWYGNKKMHLVTLVHVTYLIVLENPFREPKIIQVTMINQRRSVRFHVLTAPTQDENSNNKRLISKSLLSNKRDKTENGHSYADYPKAIR